MNFFRSKMIVSSEEDDDYTTSLTTLSLSTSTAPPPQPPPPPLSRPPGPSRRTPAQRRVSKKEVIKNDIIPPPYPWATDRRAKVHKLTDLKTMQINIIEGQVQCKSCKKQYEMKFNLEEKLHQVVGWFTDNEESRYDRAPEKWMIPVLPNCEKCGQENSVKAIISGEMEKINWLFLLLGEMIGLCNLMQLRYFCKHTDNNCTGAKNRLLYITYLTLCNQLLPRQEE